nr:hypothetical protein [Tanacetum cinerariifolium]
CSNQDDVLNISTSFFVTNFPEQTTAKELWRLCKQMGMSLVFSFLTGDLNWAAKVGISSLSHAKVLKPVLVLDDSCTHEPDLALSLTKVLGKEPGAKASFHEDVNVSGGILCVWDPNLYYKENSTVSNSFIAIMGNWLPNNKKWNGDVLLMGDFNEVLLEEERYGSIFNSRGAAAFNSFIVDSGLVEVPSCGFSFTWSHRSATKMSRLDCFLVSEDLQRSCPNLSSLTLDHYLSDHRHGFDSFLSDTWCNINIIEPNAMFKMAKKLQILKGHIRVCVKGKRASASNLKKDLKNKLSNIDSLIDKGKVSSAILEDRLDTMNKLASLENIESSELAQKEKVKWSIEDPTAVKKEFFSHFQNRFEAPCATYLFMDMEFPNRLSSDQALDLERHFSNEEIKGAVYDCGLDKSPGPDGFTFGFYRRYWSLLEDEVAEVVNNFYNNGFCHKGGNSSFIALIPKTQGAKLVKEKQEKDKIGSKPDKNGKRVEAGKSLKQLQLKEEEKPKKTKKEWPKTHTRIKSYASLKK